MENAAVIAQASFAQGREGLPLHDSNTMNMNVTVGCADLGAPY